MLLGSFDILMSRTGQRTNDVMKVLTIASVVILPSTLIAGVLGMNFHPPFFDSPNLFWAALGLMALAHLRHPGSSAPHALDLERLAGAANPSEPRAPTATTDI